MSAYYNPHHFNMMATSTAVRSDPPAIRFHPPYQRLLRRKAFLQTLRRIIKEDALLRLDNFALFDAVARRGGFEQVVAKGRWEQIAFSLQYEKKLWGHQKYYQEVLLASEAELLMTCGCSEQLQGQTYQFHLIPGNNLTNSYYHLTPSELLFADAHFFSLDQYFNLKTLVLAPADLTRVPVEYAEKYVALKKWLMFSGQLRYPGLKQAKLLGLNERTEVKVVIVGLSLGSLLLADRLSQIGISVAIVDKGRREGRMRDDFQVVQNGVALFQGGTSRTAYTHILEQFAVTLGDVPIPTNGMLVLDQQGKPYAEQRIRASQEHFLGILQQLRGEVMSRKNLYQQVVTRMIRRKLDHERFLIRWHYDRYMTFNRLKGDASAVADLAAYQGKRFAKHTAQGHSLSVVLSIEKLLARLKERKNFSILHNPIELITYQGDTWTLHSRTEPVTAQHLVYADQEGIFRGVLDGNPRVHQVGAEIMGQSSGLLQQLTVMRYINCLFRFRQKILLRQPLKNQTCFSICCAHGFVYFFVLNSGTEILAVLKCYHTSNINYYSEVFALLESKCLVKNNRLVNEELFAYEYTFGLKDEKYMEAIVRLKRQEKLSLLLPITTTNCPHRMPALLDLANYLAANILDEVYPNYQQHDPSYRELFRIQPPKRKEGRKKEKEGGGVNSLPSLPSLHSLPSNKSISQELSNSKVRFIAITIPPNPTPAPMAQQIKVTQNELPKVATLGQLQEDWFGLKHTIVRGHQQFIKSRIDSGGKLKDALAGVQQLQLSVSTPLQLYQGTYLISLGQVRFKEQEWFGCILSTPLPASFVFPLHGLASRRQFISLNDTLRTTIYFHIVLLVHNQPMYVIIDEQRPNVRFFHRNVNALMDAFVRKLEAVRSEQLGNGTRSYAGLKVMRCRFDRHAPTQFLPSSIEQAIIDEMTHLGDTPLDQILENKLQAACRTEVLPRFMGNDPTLPLLPPQPSPPTATEIYTEISIYVQSLLRVYQLRNFNLFQLFFGCLSEQHMACQIMRRFTLSPLTYFDLEKLDEPLCKEIQEIFSKNVPNELYGLLVAPEEGSILFHRNFLHPRHRNAFMRYSLIREMHEGKPLLFLLDENGGKELVTDQHETMRTIVGTLLNLHSPQQIIESLQRLASLQVQAETGLTPRLKAFYKMTKKYLTQPPPQSSINKLTDKCKLLSEQQRTTLFSLMKRGRIRWINGQMILIHK